MKMKNVLWAALVGVAVSCTVSRRIDKWGYRVSFDKKKQSEIINEEVAAVPMTNQNRSIPQEAKNEPVVSLDETVRVEPIAEVNTPMVKAGVVIKKNANQASALAAVKLNKKAERIMAKLNSNEAKTRDSDNDLILGIILCVIGLAPFGVLIAKGKGSEFKTNLMLWLGGIICVILGLVIPIITLSWFGLIFSALGSILWLSSIIHGLVTILK
jgi:hypothetical protein